MSYPARAFALLALLLVATLANAQVGIGPPYFDLPAAEAARTHAFRLYNYTANDIDFAVTLAPWDMDENGAVVLQPTSGSSIDQFTVVAPRQATVRANGTQAIRFSVRPAIELPPGEHRVMLIVDEIAKPAEEDEKTKVRSRFQFRSAVYVQVGDAKRTARIDRATADANGFRFDVTATGTANTRFSGQYAVWKRAAFPGVAKTGEIEGLGKPETKLPEGIVRAAPLPTEPVLPNRKRGLSLAFETPLEPGEYVVDFNGKLGEDVVDRSLELTVPAAPKPK